MHSEKSKTIDFSKLVKLNRRDIFFNVSPYPYYKCHEGTYYCDISLPEKGTLLYKGDKYEFEHSHEFDEGDTYFVLKDNEIFGYFLYYMGVSADDEMQAFLEEIELIENPQEKRYAKIHLALLTEEGHNALTKALLGE